MNAEQISTRSLKSGMMVAKDVFTQFDQLILPRSTIITDQIINRLESYHIPYIWISKNEKEIESIKNTLKEPSLSQRIQSSPEFIVFKQEYDRKTEVLKDLLSDVAFSNESIDTKELLEIPSSFLDSTLNKGEIFTILSNLHSDDMTYQHSINASLFAGIMAKWASFSDEEIQLVSLGALLHDIGKLKIPNDILCKQGKLTDKEFQIIKSHTTIGYELLKNNNIDNNVALLALSHHERYDGSGYPFGLKGGEISKLVTILSIADVYEALTSKRCYKEAVCPFETIRFFEENGLKQFGPDYLFPILKSIAEIYISHKVLLNDGRTGTVIYINNNKLSKPVIALENQEFLDLSAENSLYIIEII